MIDVSTAADVTSRRNAELEAARLYREHRQTIFRLCSRLLRRPEDAADALQTTFVYALTSLRRGVVPEFELAWLWKIATNVCSSYRRGLSRRAQLESGGDVDALQETVGAPERPAFALGAEELRVALSALPASQRRAVLLREWKGLSYEEIGAELGLSKAGTETLLYRGRRTLAKKLEDMHGSYVADGFSLASLARSLWGSGMAKTAVAVGAVASITGAAIVAPGAPPPHVHRQAVTVGGAMTPRSPRPLSSTLIPLQTDGRTPVVRVRPGDHWRRVIPIAPRTTPAASRAHLPAREASPTPTETPPTTHVDAVQAPPPATPVLSEPSVPALPAPAIPAQATSVLSAVQAPSLAVQPPALPTP